MKIAIVGGGALGLLFSYYMNLFYDVTLYVRNDRQKRKLINEGLKLQKGNEAFQAAVKVESVQEWGKEEEDLSIICVKQYHLSDLFSSRPAIKHPLFFIQNGMGHLHLLETLPSQSILLGSVEHGAYRLNENTVVHTGVNRTRIAILKGIDKYFLQSFISPFADCFPFIVEENYMEMLERKLVVNACINPLTAILKVQNGRLKDNSYYKQIVDLVFNEISEVLSLGEKKEDYYENVLQVMTKTADNESSMLKDIRAGRQTEIDAILGYIIGEAKRKNAQVPLIATLYSFIKGLEIEGGGR